MRKHSIVIVGGGPMCTYALERLAAILPGTRFGEVSIAVFERTGEFGAGATHSYSQAPTSYMNRVASQIAFASDESNVDSPRLIPAELRPTFAEWSLDRFRQTGNHCFHLLPSYIPRRHLHGEALREMFERFVGILRMAHGITVDLYDVEVVDVERDSESSCFRVYPAGPARWHIKADHVLLVTGHSYNRPAMGSLAERLTLHAQNYLPSRYVLHPYPLAKHVTETNVPAGCSAVVLGMGLTAIDILLHLTEGRGGVFVPEQEEGPCPTLRYFPSGREPAKIMPVSPSGMFMSCRPENQKASDPSGRAHSALEHLGVFLTVDAISALRKNLGTPVTFADGVVRQLDFDLHIFPLVVLEMAYVYYATLFGTPFAQDLQHMVEPLYRHFIKKGAPSRDAAIATLLHPLETRFEEVADYLEAAEETAVREEWRFFDVMGVKDAFRRTIFGESVSPTTSPWEHSGNVRDHRFDWHTLFDPLAGAAAGGGRDWKAHMIEYMRRDNLAAAQGNLCNPVKAACDGVWRDLRSVFSEVADFGGLTAESHHRFIKIWFRYYTRMSNGIGLEPMRKVLALVESGLVDVSIGPSPTVEPTPGRPRFQVRGGVTGAEYEVDVVIEGHSVPFDPEQDAGLLYPNLYRRGLVRRWRNPAAASEKDFYPGGLDVSRDFHPVQSDGSVERGLTILGVPTEGVAFFQLSAARPRSNSAILNNVARWANQIVESFTSEPVVASGPSRESSDCLSIKTFRDRVRSLLLSERARSTPHHVVILAIDGIPYELAACEWPNARIDELQSVFPATSPTAWLSSLTGAEVARHGIPGVVFKAINGKLINVFEYEGRLDCPSMGNIFSDAAALGYIPVSIAGDWEPYPCSWRDALLIHSRIAFGYRFYTASPELPPEALVDEMMRAIHACLEAQPVGVPKLVWCFVDADHRIHRHGYDPNLLRFIRLLDRAASDLASEGNIVLAHSDHGLLFTEHTAEIARLIRDLELQHGCQIGGAGRTRWIYSPPKGEDRVISMLEQSLPRSVRIRHADDLFPAGSLARSRVGNIVLVAEGSEFVTMPGHCFDHGSFTNVEMSVPFAEWSA